MSVRRNRRTVVVIAALSVAVAVAVAVLLIRQASAPADAVSGASLEPAESGYLSVGQLEMYYQIHGAGEPLVLLHGGLSTIEGSFATILPRLAAWRKVIALEQQAHGRTADIDRELSYRNMADDTAQALGKLGVARADVVGYSSGANVALQLAVRHPEQVARIAAFAPFYMRDGYRTGVLENLQQTSPESLPDIVREEYERVSDSADGWRRLVSRVAQQAAEFEDWPREELQSIQVPTLVVIGDQDIVRPEHALEISRLIPNAQFAVLPATSHNMLIERPDWVLSILNTFLVEEA